MYLNLVLLIIKIDLSYTVEIQLEKFYFYITNWRVFEHTKYTEARFVGNTSW